MPVLVPLYSCTRCPSTVESDLRGRWGGWGCFRRLPKLPYACYILYPYPVDPVSSPPCPLFPSPHDTTAWAPPARGRSHHRGRNPPPSLGPVGSLEPCRHDRWWVRDRLNTRM